MTSARTENAILLVQAEVKSAFQPNHYLGVPLYSKENM
jgi:hypothetical protein